MDWDESLAAVIKCTDAHLEQQFRQLGDLEADPSPAGALLAHEGEAPPSDSSVTGLGGAEAAASGPLEGDSLASAFLRDAWTTGRSPTPAVRAQGSFSTLFRSRQEHKRAARCQAADNQRAQFADDDAYCDQSARPAPASMHSHQQPQYQPLPPAFQAFASPTYDMASMMEQVRLSLKLEVDARAAIAERQLGALLQLCKATSEELDRLRVEVCAADRQLHTLDQVQAKLRQELTTQKDVGFHLQSLCGKDESWRMQAESQLLELRQLVAALREQCNATQSGSQDKLSRNELLVHFNAAMEPVKAQFQAATHHQAQQIAEVSRTASGSALLLDALTQKLSHGLAGELSDLRGDIAALKTQLSKLFGERVNYQRDAEQQQTKKEQDDAAVRDQRRECERQELLRLVDKARSDIMDDVKGFVADVQRKSEECAGRRLELDAIVQRAEETWRSQLASASLQAEKQLKALESQLHVEFGNGLRNLLKQIEQAKQAGAEATRASEVRVEAWEKRHCTMMDKLEKEQEERRKGLDAIHEALRSIRGDVQQSAHNVAQELRVKSTQVEYEAEKRIREAEKRAEDALERVRKDFRVRLNDMEAAVKAVEDKAMARNEQRVRGLEDAIVKTNATISDLSMALSELRTATESSIRPGKSSARDADDRDEIQSALEKQTSAFVSAIDASMQRMQLQLQLQLQAQSQAHASVYPGHWTVPSTPTAPMLTLPPYLVAASAADQRASSALPVRNPSQVAAKDVNEDCSSSEKKSSTVPASPHSIAESVSPSAPRTKATEGINETDSSTVSPALPSHEPKSLRVSSTPLSAADKIQETISLSARGAMAEAELAKARVENRRKQELELRQQQQQRCSPTPMPPPIREPQVPTAHPLSDNAAAQMPPASLARPDSTSLLPAGGANQLLPSREDLMEEAIPHMDHVQSVPAASSTKATPSLASKALSTTSDTETKADSAAVGSLEKVEPVNPSPQDMAKLSVVVTDKTSKPNAPAQPDSLAFATSVSSKPSTSTQPADSVRGTALGTTEPKRNTPSRLQADTFTPPSVETGATQASEATNPGSPSSMMQKLFSNLPRSPPVQPVERVFQRDTTVVPPPPPPPISPAPVSRATSLTRTIENSESMVDGGSESSSRALCSLCKLPVRIEQREEHESKQCPRRLVECPTCDAKMLWINLEVHSKTCGASRCESSSAPQVATSARTPSINTPTSLSSAGFVTNAHEAADSLKKCRHCSVDVPTADLLDHEARCDNILKQCPHCLRRQKMSELQEHIENCDCRLVSCPNDCGGKFLQRGIEKHLATRCPKKPDGPTSPTAGQPNSSRLTTPASPSPSILTGSTALENAARSHSTASLPQNPSPRTLASRSSSLTDGNAISSRNSPVAPVPNSSPPVSLASAVKTASSTAPSKTECKFCDDEFPANEIDAHELECDWRPKRCQHCNMVIISRDLTRHETSCKTSFKSCQHCNESMAQSALSAHSARCSKRPIKCIRCCQLFPADSIVAHSTSCKAVPGSTASVPIPVSPPSGTVHLSVSSAHASQNSIGSSMATTSSRDPPHIPRIPPPPPYPPTVGNGPLAPKPATSFPNDSMRPRATSVDSSRLNGHHSPNAVESPAERMARRSLALSQLTNPRGINSSPFAAGATAIQNPAGTTQSSADGRGGSPKLDMGKRESQTHGTESNGDEEADDGDEESDDDDGEHLTLAQVVAEWTVDNVCVWLHEDVGVPDVVSRFQQRRCNGAMLLELTESDLVNDFGIRNRIHRERILNAIEAVKMSDDDEDEDEDDEYIDDDDDDDGDEEEDGGEGNVPGHPALAAPAIGGRHPQAMPSRQAGELLPSSNAMFRRINNALDLPRK